MNAELVKKALEKVLVPQVLVNIVSRRVRQLTAGARPLISTVLPLGMADTALLEIIEGKMGFEMPEIVQLTRPVARNRKKPSTWSKPRPAVPSPAV